MIRQLANAAKVATKAVPATPKRLFVSATELKAQVSRAGFELPEYTNLAKDKSLYPSSMAQGYGVQLDIAERAGEQLRITSTKTSNGAEFHRVNLKPNGSATYHPHSGLSGKFVPDARGALQLPEVLTAPIAISKGPKDVIVLATASRTGDLVDVLTRGPTGKVKAEALQLKKGKLVKVSEKTATALRTANKAEPVRGGTSPAPSWSPATGSLAKEFAKESQNTQSAIRALGSLSESNTQKLVERLDDARASFKSEPWTRERFPDGLERKQFETDQINPYASRGEMDIPVYYKSNFTEDEYLAMVVRRFGRVMR